MSPVIHKTIKRLMLAAVGLLPSAVFGQLFHITQYSIDTGLPLNFTKAVQEDKNGYLWIAADEGLIRFDDKDAEIFSAGRVLPMAKQFFVWSADTLMSIHDLGIFRIIPKADTTIIEPFMFGASTMTDTSVYYPKKMFRDAKGRIWISEAAGVSRWMGGNRVKRYVFDKMYHPISFKRSFTFATDGERLFLASQQGYLFVFDEKNDVFTRIGGRVSRVLSEFSFDGNRTFLAACEDGLYRVTMENAGFSAEKMAAIQGTSTFRRVGSREVLIGSWESGLHILFEGRGHRPVLDISSGVINTISAGSDSKRVWVSTDNGVFLLTRAHFVHPQAPFQSNYIQGMASFGENGMVILDNSAAYLAEFDTLTGTYNRMEELYRNPPARAELLELAADGNDIWIGSNDGRLIHLRKAGFGKKPEAKVYQAPGQIHNLMIDRQQNIWMAGEGEFLLTRRQPDGTFVTYGPESGLNSRVTAFFEHTDGTIYFAASKHPKGFLYRWLPLLNRFELVPIPGLTENNTPSEISDFDADDSGNVWIAASNGLFLLKNGGLSKHEGQYASAVKSVRVAADSSVWYGMNIGLVRLKNGTEMLFTTADGLAGVTVTYRAIQISHDGRLWVGSSAGVAVSILDLRSQEQTPAPVIQRVVNGGNQERPDENGISVRFNSYLDAQFFSATYPQKQLSYYYRVAGADTSWTLTGPGRTVRLAALEPGDYVLQLKAARRGAYRESGVTSLAFTVKPPWYFSPAGLGVQALVVLLLVTGMLRYQSERLRKRTERALERERQRAEMERTLERTRIESEEARLRAALMADQNRKLAEASEKLEEALEETHRQKDALEETNRELEALQATKSLMISAVNHDLRNPLNPILNYSRPDYPRYTPVERLALINDRARSMLSLINDIMDVYRAEKMRPARAPARLFDAVGAAISIICEEKTDLPRIENNIAREAIALFEFKYIQRVFENLLSNAIKYTEPGSRGGHVEFFSRFEADSSGGGTWTVGIKDNGEGIPKEKFEEIFLPFSNPNARHIGAAKSVGIGLTFCKTIVEAHDSKMEIASEVGKGTTFSFKLPAIISEMPKSDAEKTWALSESDLELARVFSAQLRPFADELYNAEVRKILKQVPEADQNGLGGWKKALEAAIDDADEAAFLTLITL